MGTLILQEQRLRRRMGTTLWDEFCSDHLILESGVPLFKTSGQAVKTAPFGQNQQLILRRSQQMEALVIQEVIQSSSRLPEWH